MMAQTNTKSLYENVPARARWNAAVSRGAVITATQGARACPIATTAVSPRLLADYSHILTNAQTTRCPLWKTARTRPSAAMSWLGSPSTTIRSANLPGVSEPISSPKPIASAVTRVAASST